MFPTAYTEDELQQMLAANDSCPTLSIDEVKRIVGLFKQREGLREENDGDDEGDDHIIGTDWTGFAAGEFGYDNGDVNQFALGRHNISVSAGKDADLFNSTVVLQRGWLTTGDGRRAEVEEYIDEDYDNADAGEMWVPKGAQDYIAIIGLSRELLE